MKRMRGVNLGGWFSQIDCIEEKNPSFFPGFYEHIENFININDLQNISSWGFDHVRIPVDYGNLFKEPDLKPDERVFSGLDCAIDLACRQGLAVILDLHKCPGHDFAEGIDAAQLFFSDALCRRKARKVWTVLSERYGDRQEVMLEILNEPTASDSATWNEVKDEFFAHIRRFAPRSTIVIGSNRWNSAREFGSLIPVDDDNVLYSFHFYNPMVFTHQRAPWLNGESYKNHNTYPGVYRACPEHHSLPTDTGEWDRSRLARELDQVAEFRSKYKVPVACNEFGVFVGGADRVSQMNWISDFLSILKERDIGFSYWNYKNLDFGIVSDGENMYIGYPQYDNMDRIDYELVRCLMQG